MAPCFPGLGAWMRRGPLLARGPAGAREARSGLCLVVGDVLPTTGLRQREVVSEVTYETDGAALRVVGANGLTDRAARGRLLARMDATRRSTVDDVTVAGHTAQRYRGADGGDVVAWSCPPRMATFIALRRRTTCRQSRLPSLTHQALVDGTTITKRSCFPKRMASASVATSTSRRKPLMAEPQSSARNQPRPSIHSHDP